MTEKQTELHRIVLRLAESGELATLTKLMLDIESTIEKYKRLEEAVLDFVCVGQFEPWDKQAQESYETMINALKELEE